MDVGSSWVAWVPLLLALLAALPAVVVILLMCLKIKSSRKDPAIMGTEGTIYRINADKRQDEENNKEDKLKGQLDSSVAKKKARHTGSNGSVTQNGSKAATTSLTQLTPPPQQQQQPSSARTPSRAGERKLPDIPKEDTNSNLYATLDRQDSDSDEEDNDDTASKGGTNGGSTVLNMDGNGVSAHHPYAKVKKNKLEHPYATVKKAGANGGHADGHVSDNAQTSAEDNEAALLLRPQHAQHAANVSGSSDPLNRSSRAGSGRSSHVLMGEELSSSMHSVHSRQATPLPPEPIGANAAQPPPVQSPNIHFSGDSQDSSKGYTSITVREPARHIQLPSRPIDATYATVSETSDDMYAAIEDPSYIPTGNSQSNSDTYAVIDLPEEASMSAVDGGPLGASAVSMNPAVASPRRTDAQEDIYHAYSKVDKRKKKAAPAAEIPPALGPGGIPPLPPGKRPQRFSGGTIGSAIGNKLDEMYAKVNKRGSVEPDFEDPELDMPVGASAMHQGELGARPKQPQSAKSDSGSSIKMPLGRKSALKADINYSDYEVSRYDKDKTRQKEPGYETVPEAKREGSEPGYETVPDEKWNKFEYGGATDGGYETVPAERGRGGYERLPGEDPEYWRSNNSAGYETVPGDRIGQRQGSGRDPGYEVVGRSNSWRKDPGYESVHPRSHNRRADLKDPGYESVHPPSNPRRADSKRLGEPPYAKLTHEAPSDGSEVGYETIPGSKSREDRGAADYDPGYEVLPSEQTSSPANTTGDPGYEVVRQDGGRFNPQRGRLPPPEGARPQKALPVGLATNSEQEVAKAEKNTEVNTHIYV